ncbi:MAG TPA: hypothetical protein VF787_27250 [Thermoanaerobaculia bacterium]
MTTDATEGAAADSMSDSAMRAPEPDAPQPLVLPDERVALLDVAASITLARGDSEAAVLATIDEAFKAHAEEIDARGSRHREAIRGDVAALEAEIVLRDEMRVELDTLKRRRSSLQVSCATLEALIAGLEAGLIKQRHEAENAQLRKQLAALDEEEQEAQRRAASITTGNALDAAEVPAHREESIRFLEQKYTAIVATAAPALEREQALAARSITQTVSGFLLWLGYGSVAATGAVLALMMNGGDTAQFGLVIDGWRAIVESIPGDSVIARLGAGVVLVAVLLILVGASIDTAERFLLKKRDDWNREEQRHREPHVNLSPQSITRKTYTQFIALLPFLFAAGILGTILAVTPARESATDVGGNTTNAITSVLPTLGFAFVGIVIAFLATAVFVMYVVRIVEPRATGETRNGVFRNGWEFIVPPFLLIIAVVGTPLLLRSAPTPSSSLANPPIATVWVPWAAFMLISSLCLACGVVYHGVFKDAKTARERIDEIQAQLDVERALLVTGAIPRDEAIAERYAEERRRLLGLQRDLQLGRLGVTLNRGSNGSSVLKRAWRWIVRRRTGDVMVSVPGHAPPSFRPIDYETSGQLIEDLAKARTERANALAELNELEGSIHSAVQHTAIELRLSLVQRKAALDGAANAVQYEILEEKSQFAVVHQHLRLQACSVMANALSVKPFLEGVRADLAQRVPYVPNAAPPPPPPEGGNHE